MAGSAIEDEDGPMEFPSVDALAIAAGDDLLLAFFEKRCDFRLGMCKLEFENPAPTADRNFEVAPSERRVFLNFRDQGRSHQEELDAGAAGGFIRNGKILVVDLMDAVVEAPDDAFERSCSEGAPIGSMNFPWRSSSA